MAAANGTWCQRMSLAGPPQRRRSAVLRRAACGALQLTAGRRRWTRSRHPGEVRGIRVPRCSGGAEGLATIVCDIDRTALRQRSFTCSSDSPGRGRTGIVCRPPRRLWDLAAIRDRSGVHGVTLAALRRSRSLERLPPRICAVRGGFTPKLRRSGGVWCYRHSDVRRSATVENLAHKEKNLGDTKPANDNSDLLTKSDQQVRVTV